MYFLDTVRCFIFIFWYETFMGGYKFFLCLHNAYVRCFQPRSFCFEDLCLFMCPVCGVCVSDLFLSSCLESSGSIVMSMMQRSAHQRHTYKQVQYST